MTEIILIRHAQANAGARTEAEYDRLSALGRQQALWLADHLLQTGEVARVVSGTLSRQVDTARAIAGDELDHRLDPRLNELDYFSLADALKEARGVPFPTGPEEFAAHVPQVLDIWRRGEVGPHVESYEAFRDRVLGALAAAAAGGPGAALVTSTGVIAMLTAVALGLATDAKAQMFLRVRNTSVHRFELIGDSVFLTQFGATPHLDRPDRHAARTYL
ncbi:MAG TPA: histidine phosphatase family protein [Albidovulum sp.]|uniref:histidine phosphatase family protein n=1 Tax=Albidovulum sp. TaxID=1872424 RepID=UPI002D0566A0|nr:histidine phosphatase family protein [Albidovulum sp.]